MDYGIDYGSGAGGEGESAPPTSSKNASLPEPAQMSVKELKAELINLGVDFSDCYEKSELQAKLKQVQEKMRNLLTIDARTTAPASAVVIFLHGIGDTGHGWMGPIHTVSQRLPHVKFILPNAPILPVTLNQGKAMPAWYDVHGLTPESPEDEQGISISESFIGDLIKDEIGKIPPERIVLGGFSQGAAVVLNAGVRYPKKLGGVFVLSGWLPNPKSVTAASVSEANKDLPVFFAHGTADTVVLPQWGKDSHEKITTVLNKSKVRWNEYPGMTHQSTSLEMNDLAEWLLSVIP